MLALEALSDSFPNGMCATEKSECCRCLRVRLGAVLAAAFVSLAVPGHVSADPIAIYTAGSFHVSTAASGVTASDLGAGSSLTNFTATSSGNPGDGFEAANWTTAAAPGPDSAFVFTLQSDSYDMLLTGFSVDVRPQGSGPQRIAVSYSIDGGGSQSFSPALDTPAATAGNNDTFTAWDTLTFTGHVNVPSGSIVTFHISGYDAKSEGKSMQADDIAVTGTVPEPQTLLLISLMLPALFFLRIWRRPSDLSPWH